MSLTDEQLAQKIKDRERVYDEQLAPLMGKVIAICQAAGIPLLASFDISRPDDTSLTCTTFLPDLLDGKVQAPEAMVKAMRCIYGGSPR